MAPPTRPVGLRVCLQSCRLPIPPVPRFRTVTRRRRPARAKRCRPGLTVTGMKAVRHTGSRGMSRSASVRMTTMDDVQNGRIPSPYRFSDARAGWSMQTSGMRDIPKARTSTEWNPYLSLT